MQFTLYCKARLRERCWSRCASFPGQMLTVEDPPAGGVSPIVLLMSSPRIFILIIFIIFNLFIDIGVIMLCVLGLFMLDSTLVIP